MSGGLSELSIVRVEHALVHVSVLGDAGHEEPEDDHDKDALPHGGRYLIPHFLVEQMNLLKSLQVVETGGSISDSPHSQVVHVSEDIPVVTEGHLLAWLQEAVDVLCLAVVARDAHGVTHG